MKAVYDVTKGDRFRVIATDNHYGLRGEIPGVRLVKFHLQFGNNSGIATITAFAVADSPDLKRKIVLDADSGQGALVTFKTWCRVVDIPEMNRLMQEGPRDSAEAAVASLVGVPQRRSAPSDTPHIVED